MSLDIHKNVKDKLKYFHSAHKIPNIISMPKINVPKKKKTIATVATITDQPKTKEKAIQCSVKPVFGVEMYMLIVERITLFFIWLFQMKNIYYKNY